MYNNVGKFDRIIRIIFGLILILSGFQIGMTYLGFTLLFAGIIILATGVVGWCGIYSIVGFNSKGHGIDKITRKDILKAVKENSTTLNDVKIAVKDEASVPIKDEIEKKVVKKKATPKKKVSKPKSSQSKKKTTTKKPVKKKSTTKKKVVSKKSKK